MKNKICLMLLALSAIFISACTDLDETRYNELTPDQYTQDPDAPVGIIYTSLMGSGIQPYTYPGGEYVWFLQTSTDEVCVPIRKGGHWKDRNIYQQMQKHTWDGNNSVILSAWNYCYNIIGVCNVELNKEDRYSLNQQAQIRLVRAYAYLQALDMFGNIPIIKESHTGTMPANSTRAEAFKYVESELNDTIMNHLRERRTSDVWGKAILHTLKARLYLNSNVYLGTTGALPDSDPAYKAYLDSVIVSCEKVEAMGKFAISDYFTSFRVDNDLLSNSTDIICALPYKPTEGTTGNYLQMTGFAKGTQHAFGIPVMSNVVNGPCVNPGTSEDDPEALWNIFDTNDIRRLSMIGTQIKYRFNSDGTPTDPTKPQYNTDVREGGGASGAKLTYSPFFTGGFAEWNSVDDNPNAAEIGAGARMLKYEMTSSQAWEMENDLVLMRYAEILYMKAEALIRLGRPTEAQAIFDEVLAKRGYDGSNIGYEEGDIDPIDALSKRKIAVTSLTSTISGDPLEFMEKEWRREFVFENRRRTDMIRFGSFFNTWGLKTTPSTWNKAIFPIPVDILNKNPNLVQNPGY